MNQPVAYFITFHSHGSRLHGREQGSVDRTHNTWDAPFIAPDSMREDQARSAMGQGHYQLDHSRRSIVLKTIVEVCRHRAWNLHAVHVRTNHVHVVVTAQGAKPEKVMNDLKAWCTRRLREAGLLGGDEPVWSRHGSTLYLWSESAAAEKIDYTLNQQGAALTNARFPDPDADQSREA